VFTHLNAMVIGFAIKDNVKGRVAALIQVKKLMLNKKEPFIW